MNVSVVIPLYNKREGIERALRSVFEQTVQPVEIIVVNDGSTDGSEKIVGEINHPLIKLIHQVNGGVSSARNKGIEKALGEWIALLDADDYWDKDFLEVIRDIHLRYPDADAIKTSYRLFDESQVCYPQLVHETEEGILINYFKNAIKSSPPIWTGAVCIKKNALIQIGSFPLDVKIGEDLLTWSKLALEFKIAFSGKVKSNYYFPLKADEAVKFRLPDDFDYVGSQLKEMLNTENGRKVKRDLRNYISHWHKMRLHLFVHHSKFEKSRIEYFKCIHYNFFNYKAHLLILYSILPNFIKRIYKSKLMSFK